MNDNNEKKITSKTVFLNNSSFKKYEEKKTCILTKIFIDAYTFMKMIDIV